MTNKKGTKRSLLVSGLALLLCVSMLIGSTFAWFTDSVVSAGNIIKSGTLNIEMLWADGTEDPDAAATVWTDASTGAIFNYDKWEPGYTEARHIKVVNTGTLALKYRLSIVPNGEASKLADVIDVYYITAAKQIPVRADLSAYAPVGTLAELIDNGLGLDEIPSGSLAAGASFTATLVLKMQESATNEYQDLSIGTDFSVKLIATQEMAESDSFGTDYDKLAPWTGNLAQPAQDENGVWQIGSAEELAWFASYVNGYVPVTFATAAKQHNAVLTADINLNNVPWTPIGRTLTDADKAAGAHAFDFAFGGTSGNHAVFDGQGHTIYNLNVNETANAGLFGNAVYAAIKNVNVTGAKVVSNHFAGTVLAQGYALVENCHVTKATVTCTPELLGDEWDNGDKVGGVVGKISESNNNGVYGVIGCSATDVTVTAFRDAGGILGYAGNYADVKNNTVTKVTLIQDTTHDYKHYDTAAAYNINAIVGDSTRSPGVLVEGNTESDVKIVPMLSTSAAVKDALVNAKPGDVVAVAAGTYTFPASSLKEGVTLNCAEGTVFEGTSKLNINGATVIGATFSNPTGTAADQTINGTFVDCTFSGKNGLRWCYAGDVVVFENCVFDGSTYGVHFDGGANKVVFKNCTLSGFNAMGGAITQLTMEGCTFKSTGKSAYNGINLWGNTEMVDCTFVFDGKADNEWVDLCGSNTTGKFTNCVVTDGTNTKGIETVVGDYGEGNTIIINGKKTANAADDAAFDKAVANGAEAVVLSAGSYSMPGTSGNVTISGTKDTVIDLGKTGADNATFNGVTVKSTGYYGGLIDNDTIVYNDCTIDGTIYLYGEKVVFNNCTFDLEDTNDYIWVYATKNAEFNNCTFNTMGKAVLVFQDGSSVAQTVKVEGCTFNASAPAYNWDKTIHISAVSMDGSQGGSYNVILNNNTVDSDFNGLWQDKTSAGNITVTVNGATVLAPNA